MSNNIMVDSSIIIEYSKEVKTKLLNSLLADSNTQCFISETIVSECLFQFIKINSGKSPRSVEQALEIKRTLDLNNNPKMLHLFLYLPTNENIYLLAPDLMAKYNLLPNDAIIIATCKIHGITQLASHDSDFTAVCKGEGINLLTE